MFSNNENLLFSGVDVVKIWKLSYIKIFVESLMLLTVLWSLLILKFNILQMCPFKQINIF